MRVLFAMRHPGQTGANEATIRELHRRGHTVHLTFMGSARQREDRLVERLAVEADGVTWDILGPRRDEWGQIASVLRYAMDYVRTLDRRLKNARYLRLELEKPFSGRLRWAARLPYVPTWLSRVAIGVLMQLERAIPSSAAHEQHLSGVGADIVLVGSLVDNASPLDDVVKSARALGIPTVMIVTSWDDLTQKGLVRARPDRVLVWNEAQRRDLAAFQMVSESVAVVTGASRFDGAFSATASTSSEAFCARVGLDPAQPFIVYCCSHPAKVAARTEIPIVRAVISALRSSPDAAARGIGVLVRRHPLDTHWSGVDLSSLGNAVVWPVRAERPQDAVTTRNYRDTLVNGVAVVGLNTQALIDGAAAGRPALTLRDPLVSDWQDGWRHLSSAVETGLVVAASDATDLAKEIGAIIRGGESDRSDSEVVEKVVRPNGDGRSAAACTADAVEEVARTHQRRSVGTPRWLLPLRRPLGALARRLPEIDGKKAKAPATAGESSGATQATGTSIDQQIAALQLAAKRQTGGSGPIIVGPWLGEVGYELLYWIPYLKYALERFNIDPRRVTVVSRGGAASWYQYISKSYYDVFDFISPEEFRKRNEERWREQGGQKHAGVTEFDTWILEKVKKRLRVESVNVLHPSLMYQLFGFTWQEEKSLRFLSKYARYAPFQAPERAEYLGELPKKYVAVKFYFRRSFPDSDRNRAFVSSLLRELTRQTDVVLLHTGLDLDEHRELDVESSGRIHSIGHLMTPRNNLEVQSQVIAGASAFMGTYGGLSYLAPYYGVPSVGFYSNPQGFWPIHHEQAQRVFGRLVPGGLLTVNTEDMDLIGLIAAAGGALSPVTADRQR